eukprot:TRINITY_DN12807_c0_g1_i1.p2 TRINITY_DN12807_c0_g1~~TRINITY_DN12807_c0_g1_i1.p2  ORF type:complete len:397 (+),score=146.44 TRINITY_DN12807_c0_g1_i1:23-1192(+)
MDCDIPAYYPELATPITTEDFTQLAQKTLAHFLDLYRSDKWREVSTGQSDTVLYDFAHEADGLTHFKLIGKIPVPPRFIFKIVSDSSNERRKWDHDILRFEKIKDIKPDLRVIYSSFQSPSWLVSNRDACAIQSNHAIDLDGVTTYTSYGTSINFKDSPFESAYVRAVGSTGFLLKPDPNNPNETIVTRIAIVNPKGMIPASVVSLAKQKAAAGFQVMRSYCIERFEKESASFFLEEAAIQQQKAKEVESKEEAEDPEPSRMNGPDEEGFYDPIDDDMFGKWEQIIKETKNATSRIEDSTKAMQSQIQQIIDRLDNNQLTPHPSYTFQNDPSISDLNRSSNGRNTSSGMSTLAIVGIGAAVVAWPFVAFGIIEAIKRSKKPSQVANLFK